MKNSTSLIIVVVGLLILWLGVTGKFDCFGGVLTCMVSGQPAAQPGAGAVTPPGVTQSGALDRVNSKLNAFNLEYWLRGYQRASG